MTAGGPVQAGPPAGACLTAVFLKEYRNTQKRSTFFHEMPDTEYLFLTPDFRMIKVEKLFFRENFPRTDFFGKMGKEGEYGAII